MIRINLLKNAGRVPSRRPFFRRHTAAAKPTGAPAKPAARQRAARRSRVTIPFKRIVPALLLSLGVVVVGTAGWFGLRFWSAHRPPAAASSPKPVAHKEPAASGQMTRAQDGPSEFVPSTHLTPSMVEEVVRDIDPSALPAAIGLSYDDLSPKEKINYEAIFTKNILQSLTAIAPKGIGFHSLRLDGFTSIEAAGVAPSRQQVTALFNGLRKERMELHGPPRSSISPNGDQGYRFVLSCHPVFGVDPADPWLLTENLEPPGNHRAVLEKFSRLAVQCGLSLGKGLTRGITDANAEYRRFHYHLSGSGSYRNVVKFILLLHEERIPCAFSRLHLKARSSSRLRIEADIIFTFAP